MSVADRIRTAWRAHEALRAQQPAAANLTGKAELYRDVRALLDELREAADGLGVSGDAAEVRRVLRLLTIDAEYHAGLNDSEGLRDPAEAWRGYELLERTFA